MNVAESLVADLRELDSLARADSRVHRLHPLVASAVAAVFVVAVASVPARGVSSLLPFFLYPVTVVALGDLPVSLILRRVAWATPLALGLALPALLLDRDVAVHVGPIPVTGGMEVVASVTLRLLLTLSAALTLAATVGVEGIAFAGRAVLLPRAFVAQVLLLYRYIVVLAAEMSRMLRARNLRAFGRPLDLRTWGALVGTLLLRSLARGSRLHGAMELRGFDGEIRVLRTWRFTGLDAAWILFWPPTLAAFCLWDLPALLGWLLSGGAA